MAAIPDPSEDLLALEEVLVQRLRDEVAGLAWVRGVRDLKEVMEGQQVPTPACLVSYLGESIPTGEGCRAGGSQIVLQRWGVTLAVRQARDPGGMAGRRQAGPLLAAIGRALQGWCPGGVYDPLTRAASPAPLHEDLMDYFLLVFTTRIILKGDHGDG